MNKILLIIFIIIFLLTINNSSKDELAFTKTNISEKEKEDLSLQWDKDTIELIKGYISDYLKQEVKFIDFVPYQGYSNFANDWTVFTESNGVEEVKVRINKTKNKIEIFFTSNFLKF